MSSTEKKIAAKAREGSKRRVLSEAEKVRFSDAFAFAASRMDDMRCLQK